MFLKPLRDLKNTLSFRLTLWDALIFTLTSLLALSIFYLRISRITMENTDQELHEEFSEFSALMKEEQLHPFVFAGKICHGVE